MTRKDYIRLAEVLNTQFNRRHESATSLGTALMDDLCKALKADNPRFNQARFEDAVYKI